jgi:hypothetical protein
MMQSENNKLYWLLAIATLLRIIVAIAIDLGNDEVYYLTYAQHLQWNYFDHPPMVALLIRLTTLNLFFTSEFFIRLGPIVLAAVNTFLLYKITSQIKNEKAGFIAAVLFSSSIYAGVIAGIFILPDAPQLFFWITALYFLIQIVQSPETDAKWRINILLFGVFAGLCVMSKVHGVFLWFGFGLYVLIYNRKLLLNKYLYLSVIISVLIISPILFWNIENDWITYSFHSNRVTINNGINPDSFLREFIGGAFYNNPINYVLIIITLLAIIKNKCTVEVPVKRLLLLVSLPLIIVLLFISLFRDTLPHWSGPAFVGLIILASSRLSELKINPKRILQLPKSVMASGILMVVVLVAGPLVINYLPGTMGKTAEDNLGTFDATLDMYDWDFFESEFETIRQNDIKSKKTTTTFIINNKWFPAAHIDNYIAQPLQLDFVAIGNLDDIHTYHWLNQYRKPIQKGDDAYFITVSNNYSDPNLIYASQFEKINKPRIIKQYRGGKEVRNLFVYLMQAYK